MALDRDISVAVANALAERDGRLRRTGWEMLAATGVRSLRVLSETAWLQDLLLTEANSSAFRVLSANASLYEARGARVLCHDARSVPPEGPFEFVDLDPYGSPIEFVSPLLAATRVGSVAGVTATDLRVLAGVDPGSCERRYEARPLRGRLGPEGGLRILLAWLARRSAERGRGIRPLLAYVQGHYLRAYVEFTERSALPAPAIAMIDPDRFEGPSIGRRDAVGPMWLGTLFDPTFVGRLTVPSGAARPREARRLMDTWLEEATVDAPFFYEANELARTLNLPSPPRVDRVIGELRGGGWRAARTHARAGAFRTTAPRAEVERVARRDSTLRTP